MTEKKNIIGYWGCPPRETIESIKDKFPAHDWVDLDVDLGKHEKNLIPETYCRIIRNIIDNAFALKDNLELIVAAVGSDKCDGGKYASYLLKKEGFKILEVTNDDITNCENPENIRVPISRSGLPLLEKVEKITDTVIAENTIDYEAVEPTHGFWGVPPHDFEILRLFPDTTHVYGWTRTVEAGRPADIDLECYVDPGIPTVFYTQSFCAKSQLAKYLAEKHGGLYIDADGKIGMGIISRIEAFLELIRH